MKQVRITEPQRDDEQLQCKKNKQYMQKGQTKMYDKAADTQSNYVEM